MPNRVNPITVLLVDDHALVLDMLRMRLAREPDIEVVAAVASADEAVEQAAKLRPDVVILDIAMPGLSPFEAARRIRHQHPTVRIVFLSGFLQDRYIEQALDLEAAGYVSKAEPPEAVLHAIRSAVSGALYFSPDVQARILVGPTGVGLSREVGAGTRVRLLTARECEILGYIARGMPKKEIARTAGISVKTVDQHCTHIMSKLDIHDRVELTRFAIREGLAEA